MCSTDQTWQLGLTFPPVAIHIPKTGALSRKERDELKDFGKERGLRVYDDLKKLDPKLVEQARTADRRGRRRPVIDRRLAGRAARPASGRDVLSGLRAAAAVRWAEIQRPAQAAGSQNFQAAVGGGFSDVRMGRRRKALERGASSVHVGARRRYRKADRAIRRAAARNPTTSC